MYIQSRQHPSRTPGVSSAIVLSDHSAAVSDSAGIPNCTIKPETTRKNRAPEKKSMLISSPKRAAVHNIHHFNAKFIISNTKFIILNTKFINVNQ